METNTTPDPGLDPVAHLTDIERLRLMVHHLSDALVKVQVHLEKCDLGIHNLQIDMANLNSNVEMLYREQSEVSQVLFPSYC